MWNVKLLNVESRCHNLVTVQGPPLNVAQPASMHGYSGENLKYRSILVCRTPANPHFSGYCSGATAKCGSASVNALVLR